MGRLTETLGRVARIEAETRDQAFHRARAEYDGSHQRFDDAVTNYLENPTPEAAAIKQEAYQGYWEAVERRTHGYEQRTEIVLFDSRRIALHTKHVKPSRIDKEIARGRARHHQ